MIDDEELILKEAIRLDPSYAVAYSSLGASALPIGRGTFGRQPRIA